ncbi:hypothetical protein B0A53_02520 [Rhodotorula sp. CCFEE 5036]|nr:hypothetical protein B0A53_02520 [Rhodotorula sp. CCFEE 5036]
MLERLPTELISLVIDATSTGAWERKALLDSLSLVSKSYRIALRPLRESIVHVPRAAIIPLLRLWPAATRKAADTVFIGSSDQAAGLEPFSLRDYSRLLSILPKIKHIYTPKISTDFVNQLDAAQIDFCRPSDVESSGVRQIVECMKYVHVQSQDGWEVNRLLRILPGLKAVSWETSDPRASIQALESPDHPFPELTKQNIKRKSIGLFAAGLGDDDFVDFAFLRFLDSCEPRS